VIKGKASAINIIELEKTAEEIEAERRSLRKEAQAKLGLLSKAKDAAEIDRISKLSQEDLDKEIAAIQATLV
jgi:HPt (histidine-containing phosphotransfer) domain-containing protein